MQQDCIFCKIIAGEIPGKFEYQDDEFVALHDINPKAKHHLLIIPRKHIPTVADIEEGQEKMVGHMVKIANDLAKKLEFKGYKLMFNVGKEGGQEVFHIHLHLLGY